MTTFSSILECTDKYEADFDKWTYRVTDLVNNYYKVVFGYRRKFSFFVHRDWVQFLLLPNQYISLSTTASRILFKNKGSKEMPLHEFNSIAAELGKQGYAVFLDKEAYGVIGVVIKKLETDFQVRIRKRIHSTLSDFIKEQALQQDRQKALADVQTAHMKNRAKLQNEIGEHTEFVYLLKKLDSENPKIQASTKKIEVLSEKLKALDTKYKEDVAKLKADFAAKQIAKQKETQQ